MFKASDHVEVWKQIEGLPQIFPKKGVDVLRDFHLFQLPIPKSYRSSDASENLEHQDLFEVLFEIGRSNLSLGRLFEGHANALKLIETYGNDSQWKYYFDLAIHGNLFGVWNTEREFEGLSITKVDNQWILSGAKTFCSGGLNVQFPLVTARTATGLQMIILDLTKKNSLVEDWSLWNPIGMCESVSCRLDFKGMVIGENQFLGAENDYYLNPHFSWGAVRFSVVQLGGAKSIVDIVFKHLLKQNRTGDPYQRKRLGQLSILMETGNLWMEKIRHIENNGGVQNIYVNKPHIANMMRTVTLQLCEEIIGIAEKAVGVQGMMQSHPLEKAIRDLRVYLKQAGPDETLASVGIYMAETIFNDNE